MGRKRMKSKAGKSLAFAMFLVAISVLASSETMVGAEGSPGFEFDQSVVGTSTSNAPLMHNLQRKIVNDGAYWWTFFWDGTSWAYSYSSDLGTWSSPVQFWNRGPSRCGGLDVKIHGSTVYAVICNKIAGKPYKLFFKRGSISGTTITWTDEIYVWGSSTYIIGGQTARGSMRRLMIIFHVYSGVLKYYYSDDNGDTWTGGNIGGLSISSSTGGAALVAMDNGRFMAIAKRSDNLLHYVMYDGSRWGAIASLGAVTVSGWGGFQAVSDGDIVHLVYLKNDNTIACMRYDGSSWGSEETIQASVDSTSFPAISLNPNTGDVYVFWSGSPLPKHVYYRKRTSAGLWKPSPTDWIDASSSNLACNQYHSVSTAAYDGKIGFACTTGDASPFTIRFKDLQVTVDLAISRFDAPSKVYANKYFFINMTILCNDANSLVNATLGFNDVVLKWVNSTNTFSEHSDPNRYCILDSSNSERAVVNPNTVRLSWRIKLAWNYTESSKDILESNTKVYESSGQHVTGSRTGLFTFEDDLVISLPSTNDSRITPSQVVTFNGSLVYEGTSIPPEDTSGVAVKVALGSVEKNSTKLIGADGSFSLGVIGESSFGSYNYNLYAATDEDHVLVQVNVTIIDKLKVSSKGTTDPQNRLDVGGSVDVYFVVKYEYSGDYMDSGKGTVFINETEATWDSAHNWWKITVSQTTIGEWNYRVSSVKESHCGLTDFYDAVGAQQVIWDKVNITSYEAVDGRIDVGSNASFQVEGVYIFDGAIWSGTVHLNDTVTKSAVGRYSYNITRITDNSYGLATYVLSPSVSPVSIVFDRFEINHVSVDDNRINVGAIFELRYKLCYDYDDITFNPSKGSVSGFTWDNENEWWERSVAGPSLVTSTDYDETFITVSDSTYGLATKQDVDGVSVITDRVKITSLTVEDGRIDYGSNGEVRTQAVLEYDNHSLGSEDTIYINGTLMTWDAANSWFEGQFSYCEIRRYVYNITAGSEETYGITVVYNALSLPAIIWDRVEATISFSDDRINVRENATITAKGVYAYDGATWSGTVTLNDTTTKNVTGKHVYAISRITDDKHGLTIFTSNTVEIIFDRLNITLNLVDGRIDLGSRMPWNFFAAYEYDAADATPHVTLSLNDSDVKDRVGKFSFTVANANDSQHGLTAFESNNISCIWDRVSIELDITDDRIDVGDNATISWSAIYEYSDATFAGEVVLNDTTTQTKVGCHGYRVSSITDPSYGLTVFTTNEVHAISDRIKIVEGGVTEETVMLGETSTIWLRALYEYDPVVFDGPKGILYLNGSDMSWSQANSQWEHSYKATTPGIRDFIVTGISDNLYDLTAINDTIGAQTIIVLEESTSVEVGEKHIFSVFSNSTISKLDFNSTNRAISFTVSGPTGTTGYADIIIAKTLIANHNETRVYLDGDETDYTTSSKADSLLIHITYQHSTHQVVLRLGSTQAKPFERFLATPLGTAVFAIIYSMMFAGMFLLLISLSKRHSSKT